MAKLEQTLIEDFDTILNRIENGIKGGRGSATMEGWSDFREQDCRCSIRVYERYSYLLRSRVDLVPKQQWLNSLLCQTFRHYFLRSIPLAKKLFCAISEICCNNRKEMIGWNLLLMESASPLRQKKC